MNIPNVLTALRIFLIPFFIYYLLAKEYFVAAVLFITAGATDVLDGYIARKLNIVTKFGRLADPFADKLIQISALLVLTYQQKIPLIVIIIVVVKEFLMVAGSVLLYRKNFVVSANWYGKLATVVFYFAIILTMFDVAMGRYFIAFAIITTVFALLKYTISYKQIRSNLKKI